MPSPKPARLRNRLFCQAQTPPPADGACWKVEGDSLRIELARAPELAEAEGALRLEGPGLPDRILILNGLDGGFHAFANHCGCGGFRIDPVPGEEKIRCCTLMQSTFDYAGQKLSGSASKTLTIYPTSVDAGVLLIDLAAVTPGQKVK